MDPNIVKLLEDDEDDTMHSGADVEAFAAALNRDIEGDNNNNNNTSTSQPSQPHNTTATGVLPQESNSMSNQLLTQKQDSGQEVNVKVENKNDEVKKVQCQDQNSSEMVMMQHGSASGNKEQQVDSSHELNQPQAQQKDVQAQQKPEHNPSQKSGEEDRMRQPENQHQYPKLQNMNNQQTLTADSENRNKQLSFAALLPVIVPHIDKDRVMQLQTLYSKLKKQEIHKDGFLRHLRNIVGDQMLRQAVQKIQMQGQAKAQASLNSQKSSHQCQPQSQNSSQQQQQVKQPSLNASQSVDSHLFPQLHQKGHLASTNSTHVPPAKVELQSDSSFPNKEITPQKRESEHQSDLQGVHKKHVSSSSMGTVKQEKDLPTTKGLNQQQPQHLHLPQTSYPIFGANTSTYHSHPYSGQSIGISSTSLKPQSQDSQIRQVTPHQTLVPTQSGGATQPMSSRTVQEKQKSFNDPKRMHGTSFPHLQTHSALQHNPIPWQSSMGKDKIGSSLSSTPYVKQEVVVQSQEQHIPQIPASSISTSFGSGKNNQGNPAPAGTNSISNSMPTQLDSSVAVRTQVPSTTASLGPGTNIKTPPQKPTIGQKKPLDAVGTPSSLASKKQKVSGAFLDQSIEQLNDVTTVSGVDLREEEEQLFSGPKEDSRASEATRRAVQEEEEKLILQKIPLQKKLSKIMSKCGIQNMSKDVERCLSLCLEERMRGLISNLIRVSKQRVDVERSRHRTIITSDVRRQILVMNRKAKEDWDKKQADEAEKLRKTTEADGNTGADGEKDKDEGRSKNLKVNKEEDDKMRTTAANVAARVAVGGDDMLSKWQLMAEQARQKREGVDSASFTQMSKDITRKASSLGGKTSRETHDGENRSSSAGASGSMRKSGRKPVVMPHTKVVRSISVKDVLAVLEREPQMSKSTLVYRLYVRMCADSQIAE
ncbi:Transcription initiation factor tfiid subunit 4b [Thalictrum thalictroides]|uniref:Transcription initiation factor tfiid subunit 4b n=1 Tax=Thalictrum thalictroides TaxID=46969 RepID=A0A7J6VVW5_THATH|nr:Transcription initiation factor tfiid subunit 4b [Thalictrum thalictroides]